MGGATLNQTFVTAEVGDRLPAWHYRGQALLTPGSCPLKNIRPRWEGARLRLCRLNTLTFGEHRQTSQRIAVLTPAAALPQTASLTSTVSGGTSPANLHSTMEPSPQHVATAPVFAAAVAGRVSTPAAEVDDGDGHSTAAAQSTYSPTSSFEDLGALSASSSVDPEDSDGPEMCALVADPSGDVHVVCESDPAHPLSLAEAAVYNPPLSPTLLQDIEAKLEADLTTIAVTILFIVGFITLEFGVNDLIDHYYGESIFADVVCISVGLAVVFWVKLSKARLMRFDRWR